MRRKRINYSYDPTNAYSPTMGEAQFPMMPSVVIDPSLVDPSVERNSSVPVELDSSMDKQEMVTSDVVAVEQDALSTFDEFAKTKIDKGVRLLESTGITKESEKLGFKITKERIMLAATAYVMFRLMKNKVFWAGLIGAGAYFYSKNGMPLPAQAKKETLAVKEPVKSIDNGTRPLVSASPITEMDANTANELSGWI